MWKSQAVFLEFLWFWTLLETEPKTISAAKQGFQVAAIVFLPTSNLSLYVPPAERFTHSERDAVLPPRFFSLSARFTQSRQTISDETQTYSLLLFSFWLITHIVPSLASASNASSKPNTFNFPRWSSTSWFKLAFQTHKSESLSSSSHVVPALVFYSRQ